MKYAFLALFACILIFSGCKTDDDTPPAPTDYFKIIVKPAFTMNHKVKFSLTDLEGNIFETLEADSTGEIIFAKNIPPTEWLRSFHLHIIRERKNNPNGPYLSVYTYTFMEPGQVVEFEGFTNTTQNTQSQITIKRNGDTTTFKTGGYSAFGHLSSSPYVSQWMYNLSSPNDDLGSTIQLRGQGPHDVSIGLEPQLEDNKRYWYYAGEQASASEYVFDLADFTILESSQSIQASPPSPSQSVRVFGSIGEKVIQLSTDQSTDNQLDVFLPELNVDQYECRFRIQENEEYTWSSNVHGTTVPTSIQRPGINFIVLDSSINSPAASIDGASDVLIMDASNINLDVGPGNGVYEIIFWRIYSPGDQGDITLTMPSDISEWFPDHSFVNKIYTSKIDFCLLLDNSQVSGYDDYVNKLIGDDELPTEYTSGDRYDEVLWSR